MTFFGSSARRVNWARLALAAGLVLGVGCGGTESTPPTDGGAPPVSISPASVAFPATVVNAASEPTTVTIRNDSSATLTKASVAKGGKDAAEFSIGTGTCGAQLRREDSCTVTVTFTPKTPGEKSALLVYNANGGSKSIALTGIAHTAALLSVTPPDGLFGDTPVGTRSGMKTFLVKNEGSLMSSDKPTITVNGEFLAVANTCTAALAGGATCAVEVVFAPTSGGAKAGSLTASIPGATAVIIPLSGTGQAAPRLTVSPPSPVDFPDTIVGSKSAATTITVTNTATVPVTNFTFSASLDFTATLVSCPNNTIPAQGVCTLSVAFSPRAPGPIKGELSLTVMGGVPTIVQLSGTGLRRSQLVLAPASHNFGSISTGTASGNVQFTLRNDGQEDAAGVNVSITGAGKDDFNLVNSCATTLRPGNENACVIQVAYAPKQLGVSSASLTVTGTGGLMASASLGGTGVPPATISITPNTQDFGSVAVNASSPAFNFTVKNIGGASTGRVTVATVGTEFRVPADSNNCKDAVLAPNATCVLSIIFSPTSDGAKSSTLTVSTASAGETSASLTGTGVAPPVLAVTPPTGDFGTVGTGGTSTELIFTVTNTGGSTSGVVTVAPNSTQYTVSSNGCANKTLAPGATCTVGVKFTPTAVGVVMDRLVVSASPGGTSGADLTGAGVTPPTLVFEQGNTAKTVLPFGDVNVGVESASQLVFVRNTGTTATGMLSTTLGGNNPGDFAIVAGSNTCMAPLPAASFCQLALTFKPTTSGLRSAVLNIMSASGATGSLLLTGTGTALLQIRDGMSAVSTYNFGELTAGKASMSKQFTVFAVSATGTYTVDFNNAGSNFAITGGTCAGAPIPANMSCTVDISFRPQYPKGVKNGSLTITTSGGVSASVALTGTAVGPLQISPSPHNFGALPAGNVAEQVFTLTNNGPQNMNSVAVTIAGADYSVVGDTCATAPPVSNGTCAITVRFVPSSAGEKAGTLTATGSYTVAGATETDVATVALSGNSTSPAVISVAPTSQDFGQVPVGAADVTRTFTVSNATGVPASGGIARMVSGGDFALTRNGCVLADNVTAKPLQPGESCTFDVRYRPTSLGAASATLTVSAAPGGTVNVPLTGTGLTSLLLGASSVNLDVDDNGAAVENVLAQTNGKRRLTITNRSAGSINLGTSFQVSSVVGATMDGPTYFNVSPDATMGATPCGGSLAGGASCSFQLQVITPMGGTAGAKKAVFQVTGGTAPTTVSAEVAGTLLRDANIEFQDNANRDFGAVVVGASSSSHTITVRNTGGVKSGPMQAFDLTNGFTRLPATGTNLATGNPICTLGNSLGVNEDCDILLQFAPASAGAKTSTLRFYVTGAGSATGGTFSTPNVRTLTGLGLAPTSAPLTPSPVDFGTAAAGIATGIDRTVTLSNSSGGALVIGMGDISLATGAPFTIVPGSNCIGTIAAGTQCTVTVRFQPGLMQAVGSTFDTLTVAGNTASLFGIVARPPALEIVAPSEGANWGEALVGTAATKRVFTVRNKGDGVTGSAPVVTIGGAQAAEFAVASGDNTCTAVLAGGATCTVAITLTPAAIGARAATIDATGTGTTAATQVALAANGVLPSAIQIVSIGGVVGSATTVAFGNKAVASETSIDVVIKNADNAQRVTSPSFTVLDTTNFRYDTNAMVASNCASEIADNGGLEGGETCVLRVFFRPQVLPASSVAAPNMSTTLVVGGATTGLTLTLNGNAVSALSITPSGAFASTAVGATSAAVSFTVTNSADTNIGTTGQVSIARTGTDAANFRVVSDTCTGNTLAPGASCAVGVVFEPTSAGAKTANLAVSASPTNGATAALSATATP